MDSRERGMTAGSTLLRHSSGVATHTPTQGTARALRAANDTLSGGAITRDTRTRAADEASTDGGDGE